MGWERKGFVTGEFGSHKGAANDGDDADVAGRDGADVDG